MRSRSCDAEEESKAAAVARWSEHEGNNVDQVWAVQAVATKEERRKSQGAAHLKGWGGGNCAEIAHLTR